MPVDLSPVQPNMHMSMQSLNSQEQLEVALRELYQQADRNRGFCRGDAMTDRGKRMQLAKMLVLILTPVTILMGVTVYFLVDNVQARNDSINTQSSVRFSIELGKVVHKLQRERDQSVLYLSSIGPETKNYLLARYRDTDAIMFDLGDWPVNLDQQRPEYFFNKRAFEKYLSQHRNELDLLNQTIFDEISFYTDMITVFSNWLTGGISESKFAKHYGSVWRSLVAYQKVVACKEDAGIERALGTNFFAAGGFSDHETYEWFIQKVNVFKYNYKAAVRYSNDVDPLYSYHLTTDAGRNATRIIAGYRERILYRDISAPSLATATHWFDTMSTYLEQLFSIQNEVGGKILTDLDSRISSITTVVTVWTIVLVLVLAALLPALVYGVITTTDAIQSFAERIACRTEGRLFTCVEKYYHLPIVSMFIKKELNNEKRRTDSLLYQMLPKQVADQLKFKKDVNAEYFKEVTIFFSDIVDFQGYSAVCTPMQIVELLNSVYRLMDARIELYDVYKVETIGDSYMVASGLPRKNGNRHASEIANMSLDLKASLSDLEVTFLVAGGGNRNIQLRIGIHTGPVVAGVVGNRMPRYCLFGDTVNTASRMETNSQANSIHVSHTTHKILARYGGYSFQVRGPVDIKGKGRMVTYWLLGRNLSPRQSVTQRLPLQYSTDTGNSGMSVTFRSQPARGGGKGWLAEQALDSPGKTQDLYRQDADDADDVTEHTSLKGRERRPTHTEPPRSHSWVPTTPYSIEVSGLNSVPPSYDELEEQLATGQQLNLIEGYHY